MKKETREYFEKAMGRVLDDFQILDEYDPEFLEALASIRKSILPTEKEAARSVIPLKFKELMMVAIEAAAGRGERGMTHAKKAIRAGATPKEVQEALAICIYLVGMSSWVDSGKYCLQAAVEEERKMKRGEKFSWRREVSTHSGRNRT